MREITNGNGAPRDPRLLEGVLSKVPLFRSIGQRQVADLAARAEVKRLHLFHHDPDQTDADIDAKLDETREELVRLGSKVVCEAPAEGSELVL